MRTNSRVGRACLLAANKHSHALCRLFKQAHNNSKLQQPCSIYTWLDQNNITILQAITQFFVTRQHRMNSVSQGHFCLTQISNHTPWCSTHSWWTPAWPAWGLAAATAIAAAAASAAAIPTTNASSAWALILQVLGSHLHRLAKQASLEKVCVCVCPVRIELQIIALEQQMIMVQFCPIKRKKSLTQTSPESLLAVMRIVRIHLLVEAK